ncbi:MAG: type II toxin-antitoxin system MqsA family antitoxin [Gammaproteobacteria bacterium]|nr:type II toxin-antitoxin system MqsA family antitoxin [Gammaproteobacteria bacterium]
MTKTKVEHCPFCGKESYYHQTKSMTLRYKSHPITVEQPGYWCNECGEGVIGGEDRKATQKELQGLRAQIDGLLSPDDIKLIREKLKLTQQKASDLFGGGVNAFSRYERGETPIPRAASQLLQLLGAHPNLLTELSKSSIKTNPNKANKGKMAATG